MSRSPHVVHQSCHSFGGTITQERFLSACDLVTADEARARLGVGSDVDLLSGLVKRRGGSLAPGTDAWLVDLGVLGEPVELSDDALATWAGVEILETGDTL